MGNFMVYFLIGLLAAVPFWCHCCQTSRDCPNCRRTLSRFVAPWNKTRRQWVNGGFYCPQCLIEVDLQGKQVSLDEPPISTAAFLRVLVPALLAPVLVVIVSYFAFNWGKELIKRQALTGEVQSGVLIISRRPAPITRHLVPVGKSFVLELSFTNLGWHN